MTAITTQLVFARWERRHPHEAAVDRDPRDDSPCLSEGCQTFAWRGYAGLCGWCHDERLAEVENTGDWKARGDS